MSTKRLKDFITKLHNEMEATSKEYRDATGNLKTTNLTYKETDIRQALDILVNTESINISKGTKNKLKTQVNAGKTAKGKGKGMKSKYDTLVSKLTKNMRAKFKAFSKGKKNVVARQTKFGINCTMIASDNTNTFGALFNVYEQTLNTFYKDFLKLIGKKEGIKRKSGSSDEIRTVDTAGLAFNLSHQKGSNVEHQMNDAVHAALGKSDSSSKAENIQGDLTKLIGSADADLIFSMYKNNKMGEVSVSISSALLNLQQSKDEKKLLKDFKAVMEKMKTQLASTKGSDSLVESHRKKILKKVLKPFKDMKNATVIAEDTKIVENLAVVTTAINTSIQRSTGKRKERINKKSTKRGQARKPARKMGLKSLLAILNSKLPATVADNMGDPGLENRTGRFAQSVRAVNVLPTAKGFSSVGYTYKKDPYQVFETSSSTKFSSPARDPRKLIDQSIREIAAQHSLGRLFTRRV